MTLPNWIDLRDVPRTNPRGRRRKLRPIDTRYGATVHQTAGPVGDGLSMPAHVLIKQSGAVHVLHPLESRIEHGHALNGPTVGVEIECREYGLVGKPVTFWRSRRERLGWSATKPKPTIGRVVPGYTWHPPRSIDELYLPVRDVQLVALASVLDWIASELLPGRMAIYTHRQGHKSRTADPGEAIARFCDDLRAQRGWRDVSLEHYGSGTPWPDQWVGRDQGVRYRAGL